MPPGFDKEKLLPVEKLFSLLIYGLALLTKGERVFCASEQKYREGRRKGWSKLAIIWKSGKIEVSSSIIAILQRNALR